MREWKRIIASFLAGIILFSAVPGNVYAEEKQKKEGEETAVTWEKAPKLPGKAPKLKDGEVQDGIYGEPEEPMTRETLAEYQAQSEDARIEAIPDKQLNVEDALDGPITFIYINGESYKDGDLTVMEGDNFSYSVSWSPHIPNNIMTWEEGSWFETVLFRVPGLNLPSVSNVSLNINGIKVGEYSLTYNKDKNNKDDYGKMTYKVVFNRYIQFFEPKTVLAFVQGSGRFSDAPVSGPIVHGSAEGTLTVTPRPEVPSVSPVPEGTGWQPSKAPTFNDNGYPFGKGVKWNSSKDSNAQANEIEWRVVFLEQLQKTQRQFLEALKDNKEWTPPESKEYVIIEDTLDANQRFHIPTAAHDKKKYGEAPFFLELPVMIPGTDNILNAASNVGNDDYDGPGEIWTFYSGGERFEEIDGESAVTSEEIEQVKAEVKNRPLSWTVTTDPKTRQQTLTINAGKLGTTDPTQGMSWEKEYINNWDKWPTKEVENKIKECDNKINALQTGLDSPLALIERRATELNNLLNRCVELPQNEGKKEEIKNDIKAWHDDYVNWRKDPNVSYLQPLDRQNEETKDWELIRPLPNLELIEKLEDCVATSDNKAVEETQEYKNYVRSLENLQKDQRTYVEHRKEYGKDWENAKENYEKALKFYQHPGVYGFVVKVRTESINPSMGTYSNRVNVTLEDKKWSAEDEASVEFKGGIVGSYNLGDVLFQKADHTYDSGDKDKVVEDIQKVEKDKAGLAGAEFQMYCGTAKPEAPTLDEKNRAHFLDRDASLNGKTYIYTHTGEEHAGDLKGDVSTLKTDDEGKLAVSRIVPGHYHWLVETKAPKGYYLSPTPIQVKNNNLDVSYQMLPNVARSVRLEKRDSFSKLPVEGAEFELFKVEADGTQTPVTGFKTKNVDGHQEGKQTYWVDEKGKEPLKTNSAGVLCIHGLDAGKYNLQEKTPAPGYKMPSTIPAYEFDLEEELPDKDDNLYDDNYHRLLTPDTPLENEPDVTTLTMTKTGVGNEKLANAGFALFRFKESEEKWKENPDNEDYWEIVDLTPENPGESQYFKTTNNVEDVTVTGDSIWAGKIPAVMTGSDGKLEITEIPVGHYSIAEVKVPSDKYQRDQRSFYFTVKGELKDGHTVMSPVQLYTEPNEKNELKDNTLKNYQKLAQIALVKYDKDDGEPAIAGEKLQGRDGWRFTKDVLKDPGSKGLAGAVFKLFMRRGASVGQTNPYPKELEDSEKIVGYKPGYDTCVAMGTTNANGVLKLEDMEGANGNKIQGLNPENYYMIEVKAPEGYLLDQEPVHLSLDEEIFEVTGDATPGLVMTAENSKVDYGLRLRKVDGEAENHTTAVGLAGARFKVEQGEKLLYFTGIPGADGEYKAVAEGTKDAVSEIVTGENGKLTIVGLEPDVEYKFTETRSPRGYKIPEGDDNSIEITTADSAQKGTLEDGVLFPENITQVGNERLTGKVLLHKQATETMEALAGAEFALYETKVTVIPPGDSDYDPNNDGATRSEDVLVRGYDPNNPDSDPDAERLVTDKDGNLEITGLPWNEKKNESYYLVETKAPEGYVLDQTKWRFTIDENSFRADGTVIPVQFPAVINSRGTLGEAVLVKADVDDHDKKLEDAHFYLEKYIWTDAAGEEVWAGYSQGMFMTDKDGEIRFLLPPGRYRLLEMKAPDGYVLEGMKPLHFTIEDAQEGSKPPLVVIDEDGSKDGVVTNRQGEAGIYFKKTLKGTERALEGVKFKVCWGIRDLENPETVDNPIEDDPFYFIHEGGGNYTHTTDSNVPGATTELVTNENGEIYAMLPKSLKEPTDKYPNTEEKPRYLFSLMWKETEAPDMVEKPYKSDDFDLIEGIFVDMPVENTLSAEAKKDFAFSVQKTDGKSKLGLQGAEFELFTVLDLGAGEKYEITLANGISEENGKVAWKDSDGKPLDEKQLGAKMNLGNTHYLRETKAPEGYVQDKTVHEITLNENHLDENLCLKPILLHIQNYQKSGSVHLKKVEKGKPDEGLAGAEFELLRKTEDADPLDTQWEHYGEERYITDKNGELHIKNLPYGSYQLVERAAPLGYLLDDPAQTLSFQIAEDGDSVELGSVENALDPNPVRDVHVKKVAAEDKDKVLPSAKFELYERKADGEYHIRQKNLYVTDAKGGFTIEKLPVGSYALKEIEAPTGYDVPDENMTYFAVGRQDKEVRLEIENAKSENEGNPETLLTVQKVWEDNDAGIRPDSVSIQLYRNGQAHGKPVKLTEKNGWKHTWESLDSKYTWHVDEAEVPEGYEKSIERKGNKWVITNTLQNGSNASPEPGYPGNSADGTPGKTSGKGTRTGDDAQLVLWLLLLGLSAAEAVLVWKRTHRHGKRRQ